MFALLPKKKLLNQRINGFNSIAVKVLEAHILKPIHRMKFGLELENVIKIFLSELGVKKAEMTGNLVSHVIEYDAAYRFRIQDILSETTKEKLIRNPRKEIKRLLRLEMERDYEFVGNKFKLFATLASLLLIVPSIKKAFRRAIKECNLQYLQLDEGDRYWVLMRKDYNFLGKTYEQRQLLLQGQQIPISIEL